MKKQNILIIFLCIFNVQIYAQEVISSSGDYFENTNGSISWTIGEPIIETFTGDNIIVTQGFQQSRLTSVSIFELDNSNYSISVSPNPTIDNIYLYADKFEDLSWQLYDFNGKLLKEDDLYSEKTTISFSDLAYSPYFLSVLKGNTIVKTFQIIKQ